MNVSNYSNAIKNASTLSGVASKLFIATVLLLPFHTQVFYYFIPAHLGLPSDITGLWKEVMLAVVAFCIGLAALKAKNTIHLQVVDILAPTFVLLLAVLAICGDDLHASFYGFRVFVEPLFVYYIARHIDIGPSTLNKFCKLFFFSGVIISLWAIFQAAILGDKFLIEMGYANSSGRLSNAFYIATFLFQRATGTFSSPNDFGIFGQMTLMTGIYLLHTSPKLNRILYYAGILVISMGLIYSYSRSAWVALIISIVLYSSLASGVKKTISRLVAPLIAASMLLIMFGIFKPEAIEPAIRHIGNTLSMEDPSVRGHLDSLNFSLEFLMSNPMGIGLGTSGPRAIEKYGGSLNSENSYFILAFDTGFGGLFLYIATLLAIFIFLKRSRTTSSSTMPFINLTLALAVGQWVAWGSLPYIVELEVTLLLFFVMGIASNIAVKSKDREWDDDLRPEPQPA